MLEICTKKHKTSPEWWPSPASSCSHLGVSKDPPHFAGRWACWGFKGGLVWFLWRFKGSQTTAQHGFLFKFMVWHSWVASLISNVEPKPLPMLAMSYLSKRRSFFWSFILQYSLRLSHTSTNSHCPTHWVRTQQLLFSGTGSASR